MNINCVPVWVFVMSMVHFESAMAIQLQQIPVSISDPIPAISSTYEASSTQTVVYTITNAVTNHSFPLSISGIYPPISRVTVSNDCGNQIPKGQATCQVGLAIQPTEMDIGKNIVQILKIDYQGRAALQKSIQFSVTGTQDGLFVTVGHDSSQDTLLPLLIHSTNGGNNWNLQNIQNGPSSAQLSSVHCVGQSETAVCAAAGQEYDTRGPLITVSDDGTTSWQQGILENPLEVGELNTTFCTGTPPNTYCVAAGNANFSQPLLAVSTLDHLKWLTPNVKDSPSSGVYHGSACLGDASNALCAVVGENNDAFQPLVISKPSGSDAWAVRTIQNSPPEGLLNAVTCIGTNSNPHCFAIGNDDGSPLVVTSHKDITSWSVQNIALSPVFGNLVSVSCTGETETALCVAVGDYIQEFPEQQKPLLVVSRDGGNTWATENLLLPGDASGELKTITCFGQGQNAICIAAGQMESSPLLLVSAPSALSWTVQSVRGLTSEGIFYTTSCTNQNGIGRCIAAGRDNQSLQPIIILSRNSGKLWEMITVSDMPQKGILNSSTATL